MFTKDNRTSGDVAEADKILLDSSAAYVTSYFNLRGQKRYNRTVPDRQGRKVTAGGSEYGRNVSKSGKRFA
jgi:hypothetical protein